MSILWEHFIYQLLFKLLSPKYHSFLVILVATSCLFSPTFVFIRPLIFMVVKENSNYRYWALNSSTFVASISCRVSTSPWTLGKWENFFRVKKKVEVWVSWKSRKVDKLLLFCKTSIMKTDFLDIFLSKINSIAKKYWRESNIQYNLFISIHFKHDIKLSWSNM